MTTLTKIIVSTVLAILMLSCDMNMAFSGVKGNGNVVSATRTVNTSFNEIEVSRGLDIYLTQSDSESIKIQADENLHEIIKTEIENGVLKVYAEENINSASSKKVMISFRDITKIEASAGSDVFSTNTIKVNKLVLQAASGSDIDLNVEAETLDCETTSGADLRIAGVTNILFLKSTSGSDIDASELNANICNAKATSGSGIVLNAKDKLYASASSGGDITYYGTPKILETSDGVSGSIKNR